MTWLMDIPDPSGYREAATALRRRSDDLVYYAQRVENTVAVTVFEGPAAEQFRSAMAEQRATVLHLCGELQSYANSMTQAAATYEVQRAEQAIALSNQRQIDVWLQ